MSSPMTQQCMKILKKADSICIGVSSEQAVKT